MYYEKPPPPRPRADSNADSAAGAAGAVSPSNVYAKTDDFTVEATGDKFTPAVRITVDGRELPTRFVSPQQLSATVPAAMIANAGARQVIVRSPDGKLYSNAITLNVNPAPIPNFVYIGIIGVYSRQTRRFFKTRVIERFLTCSGVTLLVEDSA